MRQIKFRGKDKDTGIWYTGYYCYSQDTTYCFASDYEEAAKKGNDPRHHYILFEEMTDWGMPNNKYRVDIDPNTLCQYTGLKDINHKMIFESDIVRQYADTTELGTDLYYFYKVLWDDKYARFYGEEIYTKESVLFEELEDVEVIGNIFDNKEEKIGG